MINKEALQYLIETGEENNPLVYSGNGTYSKVKLTRVQEALATELTVNSLSSLVDYIKANIDDINTSILVHVESPKTVSVYGPLNSDRQRECYLKAEALLPNNVKYDRFLNTEQFNIMLQSAFEDIGDKSILLKYTGLVKDEAVKSTGDDGISQQVTVKTGVASVGQAIVPNPVLLAPFRTFNEVLQPASKFIFRMQEGPNAAIFEADGGAWKNEAMNNIKSFLEDKLEGVENINIIA